MEGFGRRWLRPVAVILGLSLLGFAPALADEPGASADEPPSSSAPPESPAPPAAGAPDAPMVAAPNLWADTAAKAFDVIPIRLLSSSAVVVGFGAFVVSVPLVGPGFQLEGIRNSWDYFVMGPVEYTFVRPLGEF